jgi:hypothetical protein
MTVNVLIQVDKLVQLIESPVFTYLRLQLLEPEKYPYLYKCMYGILMLLPQSSAFAALKNRLNSVSAIGYLHAAPRGYVRCLDAPFRVSIPSFSRAASTWSNTNPYLARHLRQIIPAMTGRIDSRAAKTEASDGSSFWRSSAQSKSELEEPAGRTRRETMRPSSA